MAASARMPTAAPCIWVALLQRVANSDRAGLLPGALLRNAGLRFLSMDCHLPVERADTDYTRHYQRGECFAPRGAWRRQLHADEATLKRLEGEGLVAFRYATPEGETTPARTATAARAHRGIYSPICACLA